MFWIPAERREVKGGRFLTSTCTKDFSMVMNISTLRSMRDGFWKS